MSSSLAKNPKPALQRVEPAETAPIVPISATVAAGTAVPFFVEVRSDHLRETVLLKRQGLVMVLLGLFVLLRAAVL